MTEKFALHRAVIQRDLQEVERILSSKDVDINERDAAGVPPLHYAIHLGYMDVMTYLLHKGISLF